MGVNIHFKLSVCFITPVLWWCLQSCHLVDKAEFNQYRLTADDARATAFPSLTCQYLLRHQKIWKTQNHVYHCVTASVLSLETIIFSAADSYLQCKCRKVSYETEQPWRPANADNYWNNTRIQYCHSWSAFTSNWNEWKRASPWYRNRYLVFERFSGACSRPEHIGCVYLSVIDNRSSSPHKVTTLDGLSGQIMIIIVIINIKYEGLTIVIQHMWNKKQNITGNNRDNRNRFKIVHKIPEQCTEKARNQGTTKNSNIEHWAHTMKSTNIKLQNTQHGI